MRRLALILAALPLFAGDGITITSTVTLSNTSVAAQGANDPCRAEGIIRDWDATPASGNIAVFLACGIRIEFNTVNYFQVYGQRQTGVINSTDGDSSPILVPVNLFATPFLAFRMQIIPDGAGGTTTYEFWDSTMTRVASEYATYTGTTGTNSNGVTLSAPGSETMTFDAIRVFTTTVDVGSQVPVYWTVGDLGDWKFDSALTDGSGNGYTMTQSSGTPSYSSTPYQTVIKAVPYMSGAPDYSPWIAAKVGTSFTLDGTRSAQWSDSQGSETFAWTFTEKPSGAPDPTFGSASASTTTVSGHIRGGYTFELEYDADGFSPVTAELPMGAVGYDANGVVNDLSQDAQDFFGPMIAFGQNPWGFADERAQTGSELRYTLLGTPYEYEPYNSGTWLAPIWNTPQTGTITYTFNGVGVSQGGTGTTTTADISATDLSIPIANASVLQLTNLPTRIFIRTGTTQEDIRICGTTSTTGAATLTVCYDGRGFANGSSGYSFSAGWIPAQMWASGSTVGQFEVAGSGTDFVNTGEDGLCYAAPGPAGPMVYNTGTVDPTPGSTSLTGSGTTWTGIPALQANWSYFIRIEGTHSGGTPFVFVAPITITGNTAITLGRVYPSDADDGSGLTYQIIYPFYRRAALHFERADFLAPGDNGDVLEPYYVTGCEADTRFYINWSQSQPSVQMVNGTVQSGKQWSFIDNSNYVNANGLGSANFYGESLANYATWLRSGATEFLTAARGLAWSWAYYPPLHGGTDGSLGALVHTIGGGIVGSFACLVVDPDCPYDWSLVRGYAYNGELAAAATCYATDTRDRAYKLMWLALAARFDPDPTYRQQWRDALADFYASDLTCKGADNTWKNSAYFSTSGRPSVTLSGTTVTGTGLTSTYCHGIETITVTVTNGSDAITATVGTIGAAADAIILHGTKDGADYNVFWRMNRTGSTTGTLGAEWDGDSGSVSAMTIDATNQDLVVFGENQADTDLQYHYGCIYVSSTEWTLDRDWEGSGATNYAYGPENDLGFMQQWYMLGIMAGSMRIAGLSDIAIGNGQNYTELSRLASVALMADSYDANTKGIQYNSSNLAPIPYTISGSYNYTTPGFTYGEAGTAAARTLNAEAAPSLVPYVIANSYSSASKSFGDTFYGAYFGQCPLTTGGVFCDDVYIDELTDASMEAGKWFGFFFGMGMAHQWPAERVSSETYVPRIGLGRIGLGVVTGGSN